MLSDKIKYQKYNGILRNMIFCATLYKSQVIMADWLQQ